MLDFMNADDIAIIDNGGVNDVESDRPSKEEERTPPPVGIFSKSVARNQRTRKSKKAGRRCYRPLRDFQLTEHHNCGCCSTSDSDPEAAEGTGSNREGYHSIADRPIGEGHSPEPRTSEAGTPKAALAREVKFVPKVSESEETTCPIELFRLELHDRLRCIPQDFDERERLRNDWMIIHKSLPEELCRDVSDMQELLRRATCDEKAPLKQVRFTDDGKAEVRPMSALPRKEPSSEMTKTPGKMCLSPLGEKSAVEDGWIEIEVTIDSGACDTVMPAAMCGHISMLQTADSRRGVEYEVANGETIPNLGERHCLLMSENSMVMKKIVFQCADIHKPLLSVSRCADLGYQCILEDNGGMLKDKVTGEEIPIHRRGNLYVMRAWIRQDESSDFVRPQ